MSSLYRAQIILEPEQHRKLAEIEQVESRSMSEIIRALVQEFLQEQEQAAGLARELYALDALAELRCKIAEKRGTYSGDLLAEARDERDEDLLRVMRSEE